MIPPFVLGSLTGSLSTGPAAICCVGLSGSSCSGALIARPPVHPWLAARPELSPGARLFL